MGERLGPKIFNKIQTEECSGPEYSQQRCWKLLQACFLGPGSGAVDCFHSFFPTVGNLVPDGFTLATRRPTL